MHARGEQTLSSFHPDFDHKQKFIFRTRRSNVPLRFLINRLTAESKRFLNLVRYPKLNVDRLIFCDLCPEFVTGLGNQHVEIAMMVAPDGHSRLELSRFLSPQVIADHRNAPVNALGYLRAMFTVSDIEEVLERLQKHGAQLVGEVVQYGNSYKLCYLRDPEGLLIGLAEQLS